MRPASGELGALEADSVRLAARTAGLRNQTLTKAFSQSLSAVLSFLREFGANCPASINRMTTASDQHRDASAAGGSATKRRRATARHVREARDRLTSSTGTRPAFDYELLRLFAQNRLSASLVVLLLVGTVGFLSSVWTGALKAGTWTSAVLVIHAIIVSKCRQFLSAPANRTNTSSISRIDGRLGPRRKSATGRSIMTRR